MQTSHCILYRTESSESNWIESWGPKCLFKALSGSVKTFAKGSKAGNKKDLLDMKCRHEMHFLCGVKETNKFRQKRDRKKETQISPFLQYMSASNRRMFLTTSNTLLETNVILPLLEVVISFLRKQTNETTNQHSKCNQKNGGRKRVRQFNQILPTKSSTFLRPELLIISKTPVRIQLPSDPN